MKAIFFEQHGDINVLKYADLPEPKPQPGEALIRVKAVALNHLDIWVRRGWSGLHLPLPHIGGADISGEIVEINAAGTAWTNGSRVIVYPGISTTDDEWTRTGQESLSPGYKIIGEQIQGGFAEFITVPVKNLFRLPEQVSFEDGAAPLLVGVTTWRMLFKRGQLSAGDTVLVVGAGGGVNSLSIMLARSAGAHVIALAGGATKAQRALEIGAHDVIDYTKTLDWHTEVLKLTKGRGVDIVVDNVGSKTMFKSLRSVARGGKIVTVGNTRGFELSFDNRLLFTKQASLIGSTMGSRQDFIEVMDYLLQHDIKIPVDTVAPLAEGIRMIKRLEEGNQFGKIILIP